MSRIIPKATGSDGMALGKVSLSIVPSGLKGVAVGERGVEMKGSEDSRDKCLNLRISGEYSVGPVLSESSRE
jgi:hypothetical protein